MGEPKQILDRMKISGDIIIRNVKNVLLMKHMEAYTFSVRVDMYFTNHTVHNF